MTTPTTDDQTTPPPSDFQEFYLGIKIEGPEKGPFRVYWEESVSIGGKYPDEVSIIRTVFTIEEAYLYIWKMRSQQLSRILQKENFDFADKNVLQAKRKRAISKLEELLGITSSQSRLQLTQDANPANHKTDGKQPSSGPKIS
jgi:hypothetical protein